MLVKQGIILEQLRIEAERQAAEGERMGFQSGLAIGRMFDGKLDHVDDTEDGHAQEEQAPENENEGRSFARGAVFPAQERNRSGHGGRKVHCW